MLFNFLSYYTVALFAALSKFVGQSLYQYFTDDMGLRDWDYVAVIVAIISMLVAWAAYRSQSKTERNTMKITEEGQFELLIDYVRHAYANLVAIKAVYYRLAGYPDGLAPSLDDFKGRLRGRMRTHYPSEEHLRKLTIDTEALHPEAFVHSQDKYESIHNLLLLVRNYNTETAVAEKHLCDRGLAPWAKDRDLNTLIFKQNLFCQRFMGCIRKLCVPTYSRWDRMRLDPPRGLGMFKRTKEAVDDKYNSEAALRYEAKVAKVKDAIINEAVGRDNLSKAEKKLPVPEKIALLRSRLPKGINYFTDEEKEANNFRSLLFDKKDEAEMFFDLLNSNIRNEIHGRNSQGFEKIAILTFDPEEGE